MNLLSEIGLYVIRNCIGMGEAEVHLTVRGRAYLTETRGT